MSLLATLIFEIFTVILRFCFGYTADTDLAFLGFLTGGYRIHHLYVGVVTCAIPFLITINPFLNDVLLVIGTGLIVSDLVHHYLVLWPITGSPEFHIEYPDV